jgi:phage protein D
MTARATKRAMTAARPLHRIEPMADYRISLGGRDISLRFQPRLESLTLTESRADEADTVDLVLDDSRGDLALPNRGDEIRVAIGWSGAPLVDKGTFVVTEFAHSGTPDTLTVRARSASMTNGMQERRERSWHRQTISSIVRAIAARYRLTPAVADQLGRIAIAHIDQTHESDMSFLTRLAKRYDAVMNVKDLRLLFMPIGEAKSVSGKQFPGLTLTRADGDAHEYHVSERERYAAVRAYYHSNGSTRRESVVVGEAGGTNVKVLPESFASKAEAIAAAQGESGRIERSQATMRYSLARGQAELFPEMPVTVSGFKPQIDATAWLVKKATHTLTADGGFTTDLELETRGDRTTG